MRDGDRCRVCRKPVWIGDPNPEKRAHVHHLVYRSASKDLQDAPSNLMTLCGLCHAAVHAHELEIDGDDAAQALTFRFMKDGKCWTLSETKA